MQLERRTLALSTGAPGEPETRRLRRPDPSATQAFGALAGDGGCLVIIRLFGEQVRWVWFLDEGGRRDALGGHDTASGWLALGRARVRQARHLHNVLGHPVPS